MTTPRGANRVVAFVGLGSNLGDRAATIAGALRSLAAVPGVVVTGVSSLYQSAPLDADGDDYFNAVARLETTLDAVALLAALQAIERAHGRVRRYPNAPRTLDLDLLLHGHTRVRSDTLDVPHPRLAARAFVVLPLAEIEPDLVLPDGTPVASLVEGVAGQRIERLAAPASPMDSGRQR